MTTANGLRISIVVPLYNKAAYVEFALRALSEQLEPGDELIVVNDHSSDEGPMLARHVLAGVTGARVITTECNGGPATARNLGAYVSQGTHLLFFDADDLPSPALLQQLRSAIARHPHDALFAYQIAFEARGETLEPTTTTEGPVSCIRLEPHSFASESLAGRTICTASSTCISREVFIAASGFVEGLRYCEDPELWARLSAEHSIIRINRTLALYRDVSQSLSYGLRGQVGSVNRYVDSLLELEARHGGPYLPLARSLIFKNLIFSRAAGNSCSDLSSQLTKYRNHLGMKRWIAMRLLSSLPPQLFRTLLARRTRRLCAASESR